MNSKDKDTGSPVWSGMTERETGSGEGFGFPFE